MNEEYFHHLLGEWMPKCFSSYERKLHRVFCSLIKDSINAHICTHGYGDADYSHTYRATCTETQSGYAQGCGRFPCWWCVGVGWEGERTFLNKSTVLNLGSCQYPASCINWLGSYYASVLTEGKKSDYSSNDNHKEATVHVCKLNTEL